MLLEALGSAAEVTKAAGRPGLGESQADGEPLPTIRVRVERDRKDRLERLRRAQHREYASDLIRDVIDEYLERHEDDRRRIAADGR